MPRIIIDTDDTETLLRMAVFLAAYDNKEASKQIIEQVRKIEPSNLACRSTYARIVHREPDVLKAELVKEIHSYLSSENSGSCNP